MKIKVRNKWWLIRILQIARIKHLRRKYFLHALKVRLAILFDH